MENLENKNESEAVLPAKISTAKISHIKLIMDGVCSHCAHCGQALTDSVSIERGIGPICSRKGYTDEDPKDPDFHQAMVTLAPFPQVIEFMFEHFKEGSVRKLMNGLVKLCSLNRKTGFHEICCDAIEILGYTKLASTLRKSLSVIEIVKSKRFTGCYEVWVKRSEFDWRWVELMRKIPGRTFDPKDKVDVIPDSQKVALWEAVNSVYVGAILTTDSGTVKVKKK